MIKVLLALIAASMFAGAALYISLAEHPARMRLDDRAALAQWGPSYSRAAPIQAVLALVSLLLGLWAWWRIGGDWLLAGALLIGAAIPLTLAMIMPINSRLKATAPDAAGADSRALLTRWGKLHALRTMLGLGSVAAYFTAFMLP
jgi:uncharacterized membrane protein